MTVAEPQPKGALIAYDCDSIFLRSEYGILSCRRGSSIQLRMWFRDFALKRREKPPVEVSHEAHAFALVKTAVQRRRKDAMGILTKKPMLEIAIQKGWPLR